MHYDKAFKEEAVCLSDEIGIKKASEQLGVCCKIKIPKVAEQKWRKLHLQNGEKCRAPDYAL